jgi:acyl-CoA thioesterase
MTPLVTTFRSPYDEVRVDARTIDLIALPGLEQLRWGIAGKTVAPPVDRLFGITLDEVDTGTATYSMPVTGWLDWRAGVVTDGVLGVLLDSAHIGAVYTTVAPATGFVTVSTAIQLGDQVRPDAGPLTARGHVLHSTAAHVLSTVAVRDRDNRLVARSTSRSAVFPLPGPARGPALDPTTIPDATIGFRPHELPVDSQEATGNEFDTAPLAQLTGLRGLSEKDGRFAAVLPASEWFASPLGNVQGGVLAFLAERTAVGAASAALPAGSTATTQDIALTYLRRAPADDAELRATGTVMAAGKTVAHADVRIEDTKGRTLAAALATLGVHSES